jgi:Caspase domain
MADHRRALIVGIDNYPLAPLAGCVADASRISSLLSRNADGSPNFDCRLLTNPPSTIGARDLRQAIQELFAQPADIALFYFSGHGTENNLGGYLVTPDATLYQEGVAMTDVLSLANNSKVSQVVLMLDCCHSGHLGGAPEIANAAAVLRQGVSVLSASRAGEASLETSDGGVFTSLVCAALEGGGADVLGNVTTASVYSYVDEALGSWDQRPLFKTHVFRMTSLRRDNPAVPHPELRRLPELFPDPTDELPLDPSYEPTADPPNPVNEEVFAILQRCRAAKLVEVVGEQHLYYAAMNSTSCRLTPLGQRYWRLAQAGRL